MQGRIEVSAAFGGRDAAEAGMPHFRALKSAAQTIRVTDFPYPILAFVLHVSGDISEYGKSGADHPQIDPTGDHLSLDLVIGRVDLQRLAAGDSTLLCRSILETPGVLRESSHPRLAGLDFELLSREMEHLAAEYERGLTAAS